MELPEEENTPEKRVDRIFAMMDKVRRVELGLGQGGGAWPMSQLAESGDPSPFP